jgi:hypothetical protein
MTTVYPLQYQKARLSVSATPLGEGPDLQGRRLKNVELLFRAGAINQKDFSTTRYVFGNEVV